MRILLVVSSYLPNLGGLQQATSLLASQLRRRGHDVMVLTQRYPRSLPRREDMDGVPVQRLLFVLPRLHHLRAGRLDLLLAGIILGPVTLVRLCIMIARWRPDIVNLHFVGAPAPFLLAARAMLRFSYVVSLHGDDVEGLRRGMEFDRWVFRQTIIRADVVTANSRHLLTRAAEIESRAADKGQVIYNGEDLAFVSCPAEHLRRPTAVAAGRMVPKKGFDVLLSAIARCEQRAAGLRLTLYGDGPEREKLRQLARELRVEDIVTFAGRENHRALLRAMAGSSLVVVPSFKEPFGLIALEAMAAGRPVVASNVGGLPEVLEDADCFLVRPGDASDLARAIDLAFATLDTCPDFGFRNAGLAQRFSATAMVERYLSAYRMGA